MRDDSKNYIYQKISRVGKKKGDKKKIKDSFLPKILAFLLQF